MCLPTDSTKIEARCRKTLEDLRSFRINRKLWRSVQNYYQIHGNLKIFGRLKELQLTTLINKHIDCDLKCEYPKTQFNCKSSNNQKFVETGIQITDEQIDRIVKRLNDFCRLGVVAYRRDYQYPVCIDWLYLMAQLLTLEGITWNYDPVICDYSKIKLNEHLWEKVTQYLDW